MKCKDCSHAEMCKWIDELEGRGCDFGEPCEDAISRQDAIDAIYEHEFSNWCDKDEVSTILNDLPPVTQKSGKWINDKDDMPTCSECGYIPQYDRAIDDYEYSNYCPRCGAKMVEPQESGEG